MFLTIVSFWDWAEQLQQQMTVEDTGQDLTTVNVAMQKQQMIESEMVKRAAQIDSLQVFKIF